MWFQEGRKALLPLDPNIQMKMALPESVERAMELKGQSKDWETLRLREPLRFDMEQNYSSKA